MQLDTVQLCNLFVSFFGAYIRNGQLATGANNLFM
jgi:hypothetical protein